MARGRGIFIVHKNYNQAELLNKIAMCLPADRNDLRLQHTALVTTPEFKALPIDIRSESWHSSKPLIMASFRRACLLTSAVKAAHATNDFALQALIFNYNGRETIHEFRERYTATPRCHASTL